MITVTIEVTHVDNKLQFELQEASSVIAVTPPVQIDLTPTTADTSYEITFIPRHPVSSVDDAFKTSTDPSSAPEPHVAFEIEFEKVAAHCTYPSSSFSGDITVHFDLIHTIGDPFSGSPLKIEAHDPTFVFKPPS